MTSCLGLMTVLDSFGLYELGLVNGSDGTILLKVVSTIDL